jgi:hypothetical protein
VLVKLLIWSEKYTGERKFDPEYNAVTEVPEHFTVKAKSASESSATGKQGDVLFVCPRANRKNVPLFHAFHPPGNVGPGYDIIFCKSGIIE